MNMSFYMPTEVVTGKGCVSHSASRLSALGKRCLIVTGGSSAVKSGALDDVVSTLKAVGIEYSVFNKITPNPSVFTCREAGELAAGFGAEFIIGIGGGSPLDAAKAVAVFAANPGLTVDILYSMIWQNAPLPIVAVGTTAGTGSEVTPVPVLTTPAGLKKSIRDRRIYPTLSLGDPEYTASAPEQIVKSTAVDAMAHCLESYFNVNANDISRAFAFEGIRILVDTFGKLASASPIGEAEREALYNASIYGGLAISITGTAFPHAVGYFLTELHSVAHGTACAVFLPHFLHHNSTCATELTDNLLGRLGMSLDEFIALIIAVTPSCVAKVYGKERETLFPRWVNNSSIKKSLGEVSPEYINRMIFELFE